MNTFSITPYAKSRPKDAPHCACGSTGACSCTDASLDPNVVAPAAYTLATLPRRSTFMPYRRPFIVSAGAPLSPNAKTGLWIAGGVAVALAGAYAYKRYGTPTTKKSSKKSK